MNIGLDVRNIGKNRTGDETVFFHLARWLPKLDVKNQYFLLVDDRSDEEMLALEKKVNPQERENVRIEKCGSGNKFVWNSVGAYEASKRLALDVYHTQYITPLFLPATTKLVTHIHDVSFAVFPQLISFKDRMLMSLLLPRSFRVADRIVAVSEFSAQEIIKHYGVLKEKVFVASNGIDQEAFQNIHENERQRIRTKYSLPENYFLHIGTHQPRKNIPFLLKGLAEVRKRVPDAKLVLTGSPGGYHYDDAIDRVIAQYDLQEAVVFAGYVEAEDLSAVIAGSRAVIAVSRYEGFGLPILEGMASSVPVVATDIPAHKEVVGESALLVEVDNLAQLAQSLYSVWSDDSLRASLIDRGMMRVSLFSWKRTAQEVLRVYKSLIF